MARSHYVPTSVSRSRQLLLMQRGRWIPGRCGKVRWAHSATERFCQDRSTPGNGLRNPDAYSRLRRLHGIHLAAQSGKIFEKGCAGSLPWLQSRSRPEVTPSPLQESQSTPTVMCASTATRAAASNSQYFPRSSSTTPAPGDYYCAASNAPLRS
jgi:hypothetical protein